MVRSVATGRIVSVHVFHNPKQIDYFYVTNLRMIGRSRQRHILIQVANRTVFRLTSKMLDDFPSDGDSAFPISPVNSVSDALGSLHRPSPSPIPSRLEFSWSSGEIPLILYDNAYIDERVSGIFISGNNTRESVVSLVNSSTCRFSHHTQSFSTTSRNSLVDRHRDTVMMTSSASSNTVRSAATFGTRKRPASSTTETWHSRQSAGERPTQTPESTLTEDCGTGETLLSDTCFPQGEGLRLVSNCADSLVTPQRDDSDEQQLNSGERYSFSSMKRVSESVNSTNVESPSSAIRALSCNDNPGEIKGSPSAQSWFSISEWDYKDRTTHDPTSNPLKRMSLASEDVNVTGSELVPPAPPAGDGSADLEIMLPLQPSHIPETSRDHHKKFPPFGRPSDSAIHGFDTFLRATSVQFLIDQEGFRDAEPSFKFSGISRVRSSSENRSEDQFMAQFRPVSRQQFHFHHAPFETPPVLRRITVNNDDTSDYVSRQAHLALKSNGVYVIHGHEMLSAEYPSEPTKLYWRFEYLVDDRCVESSSGSRRYLEGEKTFTPLTFSCSPRLLLPSQAKRINIMHVFKKSLAPKLVAEKLQVRLGTNRSASNPSHEKTSLQKTQDFSSHDRGAGDAGHHFEWQKGSGGRRPTSLAQEALSRFSTLIPSSPEPVAKIDDHANFIDVNGHSGFPYDHGSPAINRHIVPPARLSELLIQQDSSSKKGYAPGLMTPGGSGARSSFLDASEQETFTGLTPRPRRPGS